MKLKLSPDLYNIRNKVIIKINIRECIWDNIQKYKLKNVETQIIV